MQGSSLDLINHKDYENGQRLFNEGPMIFLAGSFSKLLFIQTGQEAKKHGNG
jgi:hypothetical protein